MEFDEPARFSEKGYIGNGQQWDKLLSDYIKNPTVTTLLGPVSGIRISSLFSRYLTRPVEEELLDTILRIICDKSPFGELEFLESKFSLFGFMRNRATDEKKTPKLYLWQGDADAIAYSKKVGKYIIVDFKVVDNLSYYWQKKTDLCGKHLHQCLVYAKLLQLHMNLNYLPPSLIVVIDRVTGFQGFFPLFADYPKECKDKLDEYDWSIEQPGKLPLKMAKNDKLLREGAHDGVVPFDKKLKEIFKETATVRDLLEALHLDYDALEIVTHLDE